MVDNFRFLSYSNIRLDILVGFASLVTILVDFSNFEGLVTDLVGLEGSHFNFTSSNNLGYFGCFDQDLNFVRPR